MQLSADGWWFWRSGSGWGRSRKSNPQPPHLPIENLTQLVIQNENAPQTFRWYSREQSINIKLECYGRNLEQDCCHDVSCWQ